MIAAISLMRRRPDITLAQFRKHWLDPHGVMTAELPSVRHYVQSHCVDGPGTNALARRLGIEGIPELWFDDYKARRIAYTSKRIAECNVDSEHFVGAVKRLVTEPEVVKAPPRTEKPVKVFLFATGAPDKAWSDRAEARLAKLPGVTGYIRQNLLEQAPAPNSKIPEFKLDIAGLAEVIFADETALMAHIKALEGTGADADRTATYRVEDYLFV